MKSRAEAAVNASRIYCLCPLLEKIIIFVCYTLFYCLAISLTDLAKFGRNSRAPGNVTGFTVKSRNNRHKKSASIHGVMWSQQLF
jgi:hypothetical protein